MKLKVFKTFEQPQFLDDKISVVTNRPEMVMDEASQGGIKNANLVLIIVAVIGLLAALVTFLTLTPFGI